MKCSRKRKRDKVCTHARVRSGRREMRKAQVVFLLHTTGATCQHARHTRTHFLSLFLTETNDLARFQELILASCTRNPNLEIVICCDWPHSQKFSCLLFFCLSSEQWGKGVKKFTLRFSSPIDTFLSSWIIECFLWQNDKL